MRDLPRATGTAMVVASHGEPMLADIKCRFSRNELDPKQSVRRGAHDRREMDSRVCGELQVYLAAILAHSGALPPPAASMFSDAAACTLSGRSVPVPGSGAA